MKTFIIIAGLIVGGFILGQRQCSSSSSSKMVVEKTTVPHSNQPPTPNPPPVERIPSVRIQEEGENPGWKYVGMEGEYKIYEPTDTSTTQWFSIKQWNATYSLRDCVMQFKRFDGEIVSFRYDSARTECFLETFPGSGIFATEKWTGYQETGRAATHVRFIKNSELFDVKVGVRKLAL